MHVLVALLIAACTLTAHALEPDETWERVNGSVVFVKATPLDGEVVTGSGFVSEIGGKKCILSNRHVVVGAKSVQVGHSAGRDPFRPPSPQSLTRREVQNLEVKSFFIH